MRKLFLKSMLLLCALIVGSNVVWAVDPSWSHSFVSPEAISGSSITVDGATWTVATTPGEGSPAISTGTYSSTYGLKFGTSKSVYYGSVTFSTPYFNSYNVQSVTVNILNNGKKTGTLTAQQGATSIGSTSQEFGTAWTDLTVNTNSGSGGTLSFTYSVDQAFYLHSITVVYTTSGGGGGSDPSISLSSSSIVATEEENDGTITVTYNNIATPDAEVLFVASDGTTPADYDWLEAEINTTYNTKLDYVIGANTGAARTAYMKVHQKNTDVYSLLITITQAKKSVTSPEFSLETGNYWEGTSLTLTSEGNTVYYNITTDGTDADVPTSSSTQYTTPIILGNGTTKIKAIAYDTYGNASGVVSRTYTGIAVATLPFSFDGGKNDIVSGLIQNGLGSDYGSSPKFRFDTDDDYLVLKFSGIAGDLTFDIKTNGTGTGKEFTVSGSSNGTDFSPIKTYNDASLPANTKTSTLKIEASEIPAGTCYIRWTYTTKPTGTNIALGNINLGGIVSVSIGSTEWSTLVSSDALDFTESGINAYIIKGHTGSAITKEAVTTVPANTPLLLNAEAGTYEIPVIASSSTDVSENKLVAGTGAAVSAEDGKTKYVLAAVGEPAVATFLKIGGTSATVLVGKAYLQFDEVIAGAPELRIVEGEDNATSIENVETNEKAVKLIENGRILILRDGITYDALGRVVR